MEEYRTRSLVLASYLACAGLPADRLEMAFTKAQRPFVFWVFSDPTTELLGLVRKYEQGEARAEPRDFTDVKNRLRGELNSFLSKNDVSQP